MEWKWIDVGNGKNKTEFKEGTGKEFEMDGEGKKEWSGGDGGGFKVWNPHSQLISEIAMRCDAKARKRFLLSFITLAGFASGRVVKLVARW